jgi:hypothetical protein
MPSKKTQPVAPIHGVVRRAVKLDRDGIPIDARDWTTADWQDLHNAIERAKNAIRKRHGASSNAKSVARDE